MSRSRKKNPVFTDHGRYRKYMKRFANKTVRHYPDEFFEENREVGAFKKCFCSYDICDYRFGYKGKTFDEVLQILEEDDLRWQNWTKDRYGEAESWYDRGRGAKNAYEDALRYFRK